MLTVEIERTLEFDRNPYVWEEFLHEENVIMVERTMSR